MVSKLREKTMQWVWRIMTKAIKNYEPEKIIQFHKDIRFHPKLNFGQRIFLAEIQSMAKKGKCHFSSRSFSEIFGVSHQTIINWIKYFVQLELLEVGVDYNTPYHQQFLKLKNQD